MVSRECATVSATADDDDGGGRWMVTLFSAPTYILLKRCIYATAPQFTKLMKSATFDIVRSLVTPAVENAYACCLLYKILKL